jgi:SSS family solute:Na+ symporter
MLIFLFTRNLSDALRLFLTALVLQIVLGLDLSVSVILLGLITVIDTLVGGAKSVIWNDSIQFLIYMLGAAAAFTIIILNTPDGLSADEARARLDSVNGHLRRALETHGA